jgi:hypothetical protein
MRSKTKTLRNIVLSTFILLILFVAAGVIYTFVMGTAKPVSKQAAKKTELGIASPKPPQPAANAREGVAVYPSAEQVKVGGNFGLNVRTLPTSVCSISVLYNGRTATDSGLTPKTADSYGSVNWTWTIGPDVPPGSWPAKVTCVYRGRSAVAVANVQVV